MTIERLPKSRFRDGVVIDNKINEIIDVVNGIEERLNKSADRINELLNENEQESLHAGLIDLMNSQKKINKIELTGDFYIEKKHKGGTEIFLNETFRDETLLEDLILKKLVPYGTEETSISKDFHYGQVKITIEQLGD